MIDPKDKKRWISVIHVARKQLALDDEAYRAILSGVGISSSAELETSEQFNSLMQAFHLLGFRYTERRSKALPITEANRGGLCSERQRYYIKGLWELASRRKDEKSLRAMIKRIGHVSDIRFLSKGAATKVILALREIAWKSGFNPDGPFEEVGK